VTKQGNRRDGPDKTEAGEGTISDRFAYRALLRKNRAMNHVYRVTVAVVGSTIILIGIVLLPLPGPGWLVIFTGLFVLSTEFEWADRLLVFARDKVRAWTDWIKAQSLLIRALIGLGSLLIVAGALGGYVAWKGVPEWMPVIG
jgi:uncharacterized protein (TIGR02611 family)